jgi:hypothetical protein
MMMMMMMMREHNNIIIITRSIIYIISMRSHFCSSQGAASQQDEASCVEYLHGVGLSRIDSHYRLSRTLTHHLSKDFIPRCVKQEDHKTTNNNKLYKE